jgi:quercetin dioxygenase-like cupin family protein
VDQVMQGYERMKLFQLADYQDTSPAGFTKRVVQQSPNGLVFRLNFEPGQALPAHTHAESEIAVTVLEGEGEATVDGRTEPLRQGTLIHCDGKESFSVRNSGSSRLSLLVFLYPGNPRFASNVR